MKRETEQLIYLLAEAVAALIFAAVILIYEEFPYRPFAIIVSFLMVCVFFVAHSLTRHYTTKEIIKVTLHMLGFTK